MRSSGIARHHDFLVLFVRAPPLAFVFSILVSLAPATEFEVKVNCFNFGGSSGDATEILSCLNRVLKKIGLGRNRLIQGRKKLFEGKQKICPSCSSWLRRMCYNTPRFTEHKRPAARHVECWNVSIHRASTIPPILQTRITL